MVNGPHLETLDLFDGKHHLLEFGIVQRFDQPRGVQPRELVDRGGVGNRIITRIAGRRVFLHRSHDAEFAIEVGTQHVVQGRPSRVVIGEDRQSALIDTDSVLVGELTGQQISRVVVPPRHGSPVEDAVCIRDEWILRLSCS
jgi:hypothetical protein